MIDETLKTLVNRAVVKTNNFMAETELDGLAPLGIFDRSYITEQVNIDDAKHQLYLAILEVIGDDEDMFYIQIPGVEKSTTKTDNDHKHFIAGRNQLRQELRTKFKELFGEKE